MAYFVLEYSYGDLAARARVRADHIAYMARLHEEGKLVLAGPVGDGSGALVIFTADDVDQVHRMVDADPYTAHGVSVGANVRPWNVVIPDAARGTGSKTPSSP